MRTQVKDRYLKLFVLDKIGSNFVQIGHHNTMVSSLEISPTDKTTPRWDQKQREDITSYWQGQLVLVHVSERMLQYLHTVTGGREVPPYKGIFAAGDNGTITLSPWIRTQDEIELYREVVEQSGLLGLCDNPVMDLTIRQRILALQCASQTLQIPWEDMVMLSGAAR